MQIEITDNLIVLGIRYLHRSPYSLKSLANADGEEEHNVECLPVKLFFQPSVPESLITVNYERFISIDLDAGDIFDEAEHVHIYIPKKFVDNPRTVFGIFIDGIWLDHYYDYAVACDSVFLTKKEAEQFLAENREWVV